jgi:hypothetical protein
VNIMTIYDEICAAFRETLPRRVALHESIKELPHKLRSTISDEMGAPAGAVEWLTAIHQRRVPYVYLAWPVAKEDGTWNWEPCFDDDCLRRDGDGILWFGLGLALISPEARPHFVHVTIFLEDIREDAVKLVIRNAPGSIELKFGEPESYTRAAKQIAQWWKTIQSDPRATLGEAAPVGFGRSGAQP